MDKSVRLDVFGKKMKAQYTDKGWQLSIVGAEGKSRPVMDFIIPNHVRTTDELVSFLYDVYHEAATEEHPAVIVLD